VQRNIDSQRFGFDIEVSRCEVAPFEIITPFARNIELDVIVGGWGVKSSKSSPPRTTRTILGVTCRFSRTVRVLRRELCLTRFALSGWFYL